MKRSTGSIPVNMFPFLSVLCCLIGVLILFMLMIVGTRVVAANAADVKLSPTGPDAEGISEDEFFTLSQQIDGLAQQLRERQAELREALQKRDELRALLRLKNGSSQPTSGLVNGVQLDDHPIYKLVPVSGDNVPVKHATIIEVNSLGYVVHPEHRFFDVREIPSLTAPIDRSHQPTTNLQRLFHEIYENRQQQYVIFLIRPNGVHAFDAVKRYLMQSYPPTSRDKLCAVDMGWEPFSENWIFAAADAGN